MILVGVWSELVQPPIWAAENEHGWQVSHCASIAATFIGWYVVSMTPELAADDEDAGSRPAAGRRATSFVDAEEHLRALPAAQLPGRDREHDQAPVTSEASSTCA